MHIVRMLLVGLIVGAIASWLYRGDQHLGWIGMTLIGIVGSFVGGYIGDLVSKPAAGASRALHPAGFLMSVVGALVLIFALRLLHIL